MRTKTALFLLTVLSPWLLAVVMFGGSGPQLVAALCGISGLPLLLARIGTRGRGPSVAALLSIWLLLSVSWIGLGWLTSIAELAQPSVGEAAAVLALMVLGLGLCPLILVGWIFARFFQEEGLQPEDLERLRGEQSRS